ncbi:MAG: S41 family peptidase [Planctomycetota bacterium]|jgi:hypothetical protein
MSRAIPIVAGLALLVPLAATVGQESGGANGPELTFERAWSVFDRTYGQFVNKRVDWDALYEVYRPRVTPDTTDEQLFEIIASLIRHLNDGHVWLRSEQRAVCSAPDAAHGSNDFSYDLVVFDYLSDNPSWALDGAITYDWIAEGVGYIHIRDFRADERDATAALDGVLAELAEATAMIVDVRDCPGGTGQVANRLADRFADRRRHFMSSRMRYGPEHDDTLPMHFHVQPRGPAPFTKSTILLTNRSTASAAERFTLAMRVLPHVTHVGDYTSGAFSAQYPAPLPNGWSLLVSYKMSMDHTGLCWDGIGVMPDLFARNRADEIKARSDRALEFAVELAQHAPLRLQDESESLRHVRTSLVEAYVEELEAGGVDAAAGAVREVRSGDDDSFFLDVKHCLKTAQGYVTQGRAADVIPLLEICRDTYPQVVMTYGLLAEAYLKSGDAERARTTVAAGESLVPTFPWERPQLDRVRALLAERHSRGAGSTR